MQACSLGIQINRIAGALAAFGVALVFFDACMQSTRPAEHPASQQVIQEPVIDAAPVQQSGEQWKVATADTVTITVAAPGAEAVKILYRPVIVEGRHIVPL